MDNMSYQDIHDCLLALKTEIEGGHRILKEIRTNEEEFVLNCNKKQEIQAVYAVPPQQGLNYAQLLSDCGIRIEETLTEPVDLLLQENLRIFLQLVQRFEHVIGKNIQIVTNVHVQLISNKLVVWKHEQQKVAAGILKTSSIPLDQIQNWCEELAILIWACYEQLQEAEHILRYGTLQTGNVSNLTFVQLRTEEVTKLLGELLNNTLVVEQQPPQLVKMNTKFPKPVVVSLLIGKRLNIHMNGPELSASIISEEQARAIPTSHKIKTIGEIMNARVPMDRSKEDSKRMQFVFKNMQLKTIKRTDRRASLLGNERVMEEKSCLYFEFVVTLGRLKFKVATISFPLVVTSHVSQEALALASTSWDNAFSKIGRVPFQVADAARWEDVAQILSWKFIEITGRGLTKDNLDCLARKAFKNQHPSTEIIKWTQLCKENLPGKNFSFWTWFHGALKLIEREKNLRDLWKGGLIDGFIERDIAETCVSCSDVGTFLLRFPDSILGAITIVLSKEPGTSISLNPFQSQHLQAKKLATVVKEINDLKFLYQPTGIIPKDDAFGKYCDTQNAKVPGYVETVTSIIDEDSKQISSSITPGVSSIWSNKNFHKKQIDNSADTISSSGLSGFLTTTLQESSSLYLSSDSSSSPSFSETASPGNIADRQHQTLETPIPVDSSRGNVFQFCNEFDTIMKVFQGGQDVEMGEEY